MAGDPESSEEKQLDCSLHTVATTTDEKQVMAYQNIFYLRLVALYVVISDPLIAVVGIRYLLFIVEDTDRTRLGEKLTNLSSDINNLNIETCRNTSLDNV